MKEEYRSIYDRFAATARAFSDEAAVVTDRSSFTWDELRRDVDLAAFRLSRVGVEAGSPVALLIGNEPRFLILFLALARLGAPAVPLDPGSVGASLSIALEDCGAKLLLCSSTGPVLEQDEVPDGVKVVVIGNDGGDEGPAPRRPPVDPGTTAAILYTSGTTGRPKGVVLSHRCYLSAGAVMVDAVGYTSADRIMVVLPLFHANPQFYAVMAALTCGASLALVGRFSVSDFWPAAVRLGATSFTYVGSVLTLVRSVPAPDDHQVRRCVGGGAPSATWKALEEEVGVRVHELYGMTETGGFATINTNNATKRGTCGLVRDDMEVAILDEHDNVQPGDVPGEIAIRPREPHVLFDGYHERPEVTLERFRNLWFHTGDIGRLDDDGFLEFLGRDEHVIRRGGESIAPGLIEAICADHPDVAEAVAIGRPHEILGEEIKLIVVPKPAGDLDIRSVHLHLSRNLPPSHIPRYYVPAPSVPKTPTQKPRLDLLRDAEDGMVDAKMFGWMS